MPKKQAGKSFLTLWIIWAAMLMSLGIYVLICHVAGDQVRAGISPDMPL
jgi:hypothetical protein